MLFIFMDGDPAVANDVMPHPLPFMSLCHISLITMTYIHVLDTLVCVNTQPNVSFIAFICIARVPSFLGIVDEGLVSIVQPFDESRLRCVFFLSDCFI